MKQMHQINLGMSNMDGVIDEGFPEALQAQPGEVCGQHSAMNFCGYVWFADGKFHEEVWMYGSPISTLTADTLPELMNLVNGKYGSN
jgi:hypothetical protein